MPSILIRNGEIVTAGEPVRSDILIRDGVIEELAAGNGPRAADETIDAGNLLIFPGLIDCHVHFREPGHGEAEDMESGATAALAGGMTTVCDMPNTDPPTCTIAALEDKLRRAQRVGNPKSQSPGKPQIPNPNIDIRFFFGVTKEEHMEELATVDTRDICGVKLYLGQSTGNLKVEDPTSPLTLSRKGEGLRGARGIVAEVFRVCAERDIPLVCHCEDEEVIERNTQSVRRGAPLGRPSGGISSANVGVLNARTGRPSGAPLHTDIRLHSDIRSVESAVKATADAIGLAKTYGTQLHIAHVSTADELALIRQAKTDGLRVTCEVAPHHLFLNADDYDALGTLAKVNPPLRTGDHCEALWRGVLDGTVDCIASDHAPHTLESKRAEHALEAPSGVPGVETMVPLLLSCAFGKGPQDAQGVRRGATGGAQGVRRGAPLGRPVEGNAFTNVPSCIPSAGRPNGAPLRPTDVLRLLFENPNRIFRLGKPGIAVGSPASAEASVGKPADLILVDPRATWTIRGSDLHSQCGWTPYEGWEVKGRVVRVIRR